MPNYCLLAVSSCCGLLKTKFIMKRVGKQVYNEKNQTIGDFENDMLTYNEQIENAELFLNAKEVLSVLDGLVSDVGNLLCDVADLDFEWQQAGYYETAKVLLERLRNNNR